MHRILVIGNDRNIAKVVGLSARRLGLECQSVTDPRGAATRFIDCRPDLVILDLIMPGKDGIDVMREILATGVAAQIVLVSCPGSTYVRLAEGVARFHQAAKSIILDTNRPRGRRSSRCAKA